MKKGKPKLVRNSLFLIATEMSTKLLGLVLFALVARFLGAGEVGLYAFAVAVGNFFVMAPRFGFERLVQKEVGRDPSLLYAYFREISVIKAGVSLGALILLWLFLRATGETRLLTVMLVACFVFMYSFLEFINALFRAIQKPELEIITRAVFSVANLLLGIMVLYAGRGLADFIMTQVFSVGAAVLLGIIIVERIATKVRHPLNWNVLWGHITVSAPFAGIVVALYFSHQTSTLLLSAFTGKEEIGYFAAASRLFDNLTLIPAAITGAFLPAMSQLYSSSVSLFVRTLRFTMKYLFLIAAPLVAGTVILSHPITVFLYGESFAPSAPALRILSIALLFSFWNYAGDSILIARDRERLLLKIVWWGAAIYMSTSLLLIPRFSYLGACWAVLITQAVRFFILFVFLRRYLSLRLLLQLITLPSLCVGMMGGVVFMLQDWNLWLVILIGTAVYLVTLFASGAVHQYEVDRLQGLTPNRLGLSFPEA
jgi:O-antigen/teichoic acid export membrane protein